MPKLLSNVKENIIIKSKEVLLEDGLKAMNIWILVNSTPVQT